MNNLISDQEIKFFEDLKLLLNKHKFIITDKAYFIPLIKEANCFVSSKNKISAYTRSNYIYKDDLIELCIEKSDMIIEHKII